MFKVMFARLRVVALLVTLLCYVDLHAQTVDAAEELAPAGNFLQLEELGRAPEPEIAEKAESGAAVAGAEPRVTGPALDPGFINFGYIQSTSVAPYLHYESLTHIAPPFVDFDVDGNLTNASGFTGRNANLKSGGAAQRAGTKVILCVRNAGFNDTTVLPGVMQNAARRANLVSQIATLVQNDPYCQGVNFDFEFSWNTTTRNGITAFLSAMRAALPAPKEISVYVHATYSSTLWDIPNMINNVDYVLYSTYDWATGDTAHAPSDFNNCLPHLVSYFNAGVPPGKMVLTWASYGRRWTGVTAYNANNGGAGDTSQGFYDGIYNTTLRQGDGGPFPMNYVVGDEIGWFTYNRAGTNYTQISETPASIEYKISSALSFPGSSGNYAGVRLGGVAWWSLMWVSNYFQLNSSSGPYFQSFDPISSTNVGRPPYYRHIDLLAQEILKPAGRTQFVLESFENLNDHWRDPNESPDTVANAATGFTRVTAPAGASRPPGTVNAAQMNFDFGNTGTKRAFLRHELINNAQEPTVTDSNAALARIGKNTRIRGYYHVAGNYSARTLRLALVDGLRQVEVSDPITLPSSSGWYQFAWDINDPAQINAFNTAEPALVDGNGVVNTAGPDARDISFLGFMVEGGAAGTGTITFDSLTYEDRAPDDKTYVINEFRYNTNTLEFVEISGPPGAFPTDLAIVSYNGTDGSVFKTTPLGGLTMPASGLFVVGDAGVANASAPNGVKPASWSGGDDIPGGAPSGLQLYGTSSGFVYDSVVYRAHGGIKDLSRTSTRRVAREGFGWMGETGDGTSAAGQPISLGRSAANADSNINENDFSMMVPTPGAQNGSAPLTGATYNFNTLPPDAFQAYQAPKLANPVGAGLPASTPGDTSALRIVDTRGGGVVAYLGDESLGAGNGLDINGQIYLPGGASAQAVGVGICATQGSTFFSATPGGSGYENGYWLIYENGAVGMNDGRPNHPGKFEFIQATNNNQSATVSTLLGSQLTVAPGSWATFHLRVYPAAAPSEQLVAQVNGTDVYRGPIPAGGRTTGAIVIGHRETDNVVPAAEGTWIDNLSIQTATTPSGVADFQLY